MSNSDFIGVEWHRESKGLRIQFRVTRWLALTLFFGRPGVALSFHAGLRNVFVKPLPKGTTDEQADR